MRKTPGFATVAALAMLAFPAVAQDAASPFNWSGFYIGVHGGYWAGTLSDLSGQFATGGPDPSPDYAGPFVGGQVGYNWHLENGLVVGTEVDFDMARAGYSYEDFSGITEQAYATLNWTGGATVKAGFAIERFLPYLLAGVALANNTVAFNGDTLGLAEEIRGSATHVGYTVGVGGAFQFTEHMSGFVEMRYSDYRAANYSLRRADQTAGGLSYDAALAARSIRAGINFSM